MIQLTSNIDETLEPVDVRFNLAPATYAALIRDSATLFRRYYPTESIQFKDSKGTVPLTKKTKLLLDNILQILNRKIYLLDARLREGAPVTILTMADCKFPALGGRFADPGYMRQKNEDYKQSRHYLENPVTVTCLEKDLGEMDERDFKELTRIKFGGYHDCTRLNRVDRLKLLIWSELYKKTSGFKLNKPESLFSARPARRDQPLLKDFPYRPE